MQYRKELLSLIAISLLFAAPLIIRAQQNPSGETLSNAVEVATPLRALAELLPDKLAGMSATGEVARYDAQGLETLVADSAAVYREYLIVSAASRQYVNARVDIFQTENQHAAFGLFTYFSGAAESKTLKKDAWPGGVLLPNDLVFWKDDLFVRVTGAEATRGATAYERLASSIAAAIVPARPDITRPPLLESLPSESVAAGSERYFLGPESLSRYVEHGREMFEFAGKAEAAMAEYRYDSAPMNGAMKESSKTSEITQPEETRPPVKLLIVEYHTPQFASDAMRRANDYLDTLAEDERNRIIIKREGNYIVEATNFHDRDLAQGLVNSVEYPYRVKWLHDTRLPANDAFHLEKAAQMLMSTFGLIGIGMSIALAVGVSFGTAIFLKRRKRLQEIFSDGGSMLRLDIDPFEKVILGLPPKREE